MRARLSFIPSAVLLTVLSAVAAQQQPATVVPDPVASGAAGADGQRLEKGNLFSAISLSDSKLARWWEAMIPKTSSRFPHLKLTKPVDLHITVVYIGGEWDSGDLPKIRPLALIAPAKDLPLVPTVTKLGASQHVVAIELQGAEDNWGLAVAAAKAELNKLGLKRPDTYDARFRPHVTLARASGSRPTPTEAEELGEFHLWLARELERDQAPFSLTLGPTTPVRLFLAGASRPGDGPEYVPVEDFLARQGQRPSP